MKGGVGALGVSFCSLAAFRISAGLLVLCDLLDRVWDHQSHYSDGGVFPRDLAIAWTGGRQLSPYFVTGSDLGQLALFVIAGILASMLVLGFRTRFATIGSWYMLWSLHSRNWFVLNSGDQLFLMLLFWGMFLPLGARWSLDAVRSKRSEPPQSNVLSIATLAIMLQVVGTYVASALLKTGAEWRVEGSAVYYALSVGHFARSTADLIYPFPELLKFLTFATFWLEMVGVLLVFIPIWTWRFRILVVGVMWSFHLGLFAFMHLGIFPFVCMVGWIVFIPKEFWDRAARISTKINVDRRVRRLTEARDRVVQVLYHGRPGQGAPIRVQPSLVCTTGAAVALTFVLFWNVGTIFAPIHVPKQFASIAQWLRIDQRWGMFAPYPRKIDGWTIAVAYLEDGTRIDLCRSGQPVSWTKPKDFNELYPRYRWRKLVSNLWEDRNEALRVPYASYLWDRYEESHPDSPAIQRVELYLAYTGTLPNYRTTSIRLKKLGALSVRGSDSLSNGPTPASRPD